MEKKNETPDTTSEETKRPIKAAVPFVSLHGIPGFHPTEEEGDHVRMAHMALDKGLKDRVDTGTGDQPANTGGSRFASASGKDA